MTNNEIVEYIYKTFSIKALCRNCGLNSGIDDMVSYVYMVLLEYDNVKLNYLYELKLLKPFVIRVILNQRNDKNSVYNRMFKIDFDDYVEEGLVDLDDLHLVNFVELEVGTYQDNMEYFKKKCLMIRYKHNKTLYELSDNVGVSRSMLVQYLREQREDLWAKLSNYYLYIKDEKTNSSMVNEILFCMYYREHVINGERGLAQINEAYYILKGERPVDNCSRCVQQRLNYLQNQFNQLIRLDGVSEALARKSRKVEKKKIVKNEIRTIPENTGS